MNFPFVKMQGLGNDFVILDAREQALPELDWRILADRRRGVGCDQIIVLEPSGEADAYMRIINADGSEVEACGNATRCVGRLLGGEEATIQTKAGLLKTMTDGDKVTVEMGVPQFAERELPFKGAPVELSIGNPHLVFWVEQVDAVAVETLGPEYEQHALFPNRTNVEWAQVVSPTEVKMRVWERGVGITQACGTGACAVAAAAIRLGLTQAKLEVHMPGGSLWISWAGDATSLLMQGEVSHSFSGQLPVDNYAN